MNIIAELLETTQDDYEVMIIQHYALWCSTYTSSQKSLQKFVYNQHLLNWYQLQIKDLELIFYDKLGSSKMPIQDVRALYIDTLATVSEYYPPKHLLQKIRKQTNNNI
ncbi:hypothetical protein PL373_18885 [Tenacibaculum maritimum]|nr:hypothetical protein [Tenacibaculum maritimum]MDB0603154.1 hypothetical protein [Tenacibaculum maritimum]MDB0610418.1 hypothetical protein [Tenacibaculum maritimum]